MQVEFLTSVADPTQLPKIHLPEIALIGRSNVGKSSLINHLTGKQIAKTSSLPGKTRLINFFNVNQLYFLVDLPGYGYAKVAKSEREKWPHLIEPYLLNRPNLKAVLHLIDLRHPPTEDDLIFAQFAVGLDIPIVTVFTKADKLNSSEKQLFPTRNLNVLLQKAGVKTSTWVNYSIKDGAGRNALLKVIDKIIDDAAKR